LKVSSPKKKRLNEKGEELLIEDEILEYHVEVDIQKGFIGLPEEISNHLKRSDIGPDM
jgi:hypothetical protein